MKSSPPRRIQTPRPQKKTVTALAALSLLVALLLSTPYLLAAPDKKDKKDKSKAANSSKTLNGLPIQDLTDDEAILQALNRLGFGPKPGDLERVKAMGLQKWIDQQLHPESISDAALDARLDRFPTLKMSSTKLLDEFPQPQLAARREGVSIEQYRKEQQEQNKAAAQAMQSDMQQADDRHLPNFDVDNGNGKTDPSANPGKGNGGGK